MTATVRPSSKGQIVIPKEVRDSLHWGIGVELTLVTTEYGVMLQTKIPHKRKLPAKSLRGFLQHTGAPVPIDQLCKPIEYTENIAQRPHLRHNSRLIPSKPTLSHERNPVLRRRRPL
ncbi:AbrB/MazE/SpoVT family DNA-binding domain-containing protein [Thiothrix litoralis]|nr:AbrB/MazE/SpoVT family DNA-binding domain-containing protein [Thiothrix litoralis]